MKVYVVRAYYSFEGLGPVVKGFLRESDAKELKASLVEWLKREPNDLSDGCWEKYDEQYEIWRQEHPSADVFADGFNIEELNIEE